MKSPRLSTATIITLAATLAAWSVAGAVTPPSLRGLSGTQIETLALAQMKEAKSYTVVITSAAANLSATSTTSSTLTSGIRHDVINGQHSERVFVNGVVYVYFTTALEKIYFGKVIAALTNKWVSFHSGQRFYGVFATTMTEPTLAPLIAVSGNLRVSATLTYDSQSVVGVTNAATTSGSRSAVVETLYVAERAPHLPVALVIATTTSGVMRPVDTLTFKNWGERVAVSAPAHFTPSSHFTLP